MSTRQHHYTATTKWTGNLGSGTSGYRSYSRDHEIFAAGKASAINGSSDPAFRGDPSRYSPEELLVAALSSCHMLWTLHLCAAAGIVVTEYSDDASGEMAENEDGSGQFTSVTLRPHMTITDPNRIAEAKGIHGTAHELCFIARSVNFPVWHEPVVVAEEKLSGAA
jgi:organic hydroperoxide reductase OsmC/OhrA